MTDPANAVQAAVFQRLSEISVPVFDAVPDGTPYPYVTIDDETVQNETPIYGRNRERRLFYLSVWSNYQGQQEVKRIMGEIDSALNERPLPLSTGRAVSVRVQDKRSTREPDGRTYMGSVTVRIITTHGDRK